MPEPDVTENYIRLRQREPGEFVDGSFRTITLSAGEGIHAVIGHLKSDPEGGTVVQSFLFEKDKWTVERAEAWVKDHAKRSLSSILKNYKEVDMSRDTERRIVKFVKAKVANIDEKAMEVDAVVSTGAIDRDREIIMPSAWGAKLAYYMEHPVLLDSHNYGDVNSQIGKAVSVTSDQSGLKCRFKYFAGQGNASADWAWYLAKNGEAMYSVGFIPGAEMSYDDLPTPMQAEVNSGKLRRVFNDVELLEVSQVVVGSNRGALQVIGNAAPEGEVALYAQAVQKQFGDKLPDFAVQPIKKANEAMVVCGKCQTSVDWTKEPEVSMGGVKCPKCGVTVDQTGKPATGTPVSPIPPVVPVVPPAKTEPELKTVIIEPVDVRSMQELQTVVDIWRSGKALSYSSRKSIESTIAQLKATISLLGELLALTAAKPEDSKEATAEDTMKATLDAHEKFLSNIRNSRTQ